MNNIDRILMKKLTREEYILVKEYIENLEKIADITSQYVQNTLKPLSEYEKLILRSRDIDYNTEEEYIDSEDEWKLHHT